jgi:hypothetical protein
MSLSVAVISATADSLYDVVGNACLNRIDTDDGLSDGGVKAIDILFQGKDGFRRFRDSIDARDPCRRSM